MTKTEDTTPTPEGALPRRSRKRWPVIAAGLIVIVVAAGLAVALASDDEQPSATATAETAQLAALQQGCREWMNAQGSFANADTAWCSNMVAWMQGQTRGGQMMGSRMWGDPQRLRDTCNRWMATNPAIFPDGSDPQVWCDDMITWMDQHTTDWGNWMHD